MKTIPPDIADRFSKMLKLRKVPVSQHGEYRKCLQYYLDFLINYPFAEIMSPMYFKTVSTLMPARTFLLKPAFSIPHIQ
jgi:hypothetical protein